MESNAPFRHSFLRWTLAVAAFLLIPFASRAWALPDSRDPEEWYDRARADLRVAELIFNERIDMPTVCFHAHQGVEKLLKGLMIQQGLTPPHHHDTTAFVDDLSKSEPRMGILRDAARELDRLYIPSRYPKVGIDPIGEPVAARCLRQAKPFFQLIESRPVEKVGSGGFDG